MILDTLLFLSKTLEFFENINCMLRNNNFLETLPIEHVDFGNNLVPKDGNESHDIPGATSKVKEGIHGIDHHNYWVIIADYIRWSSEPNRKRQASTCSSSNDLSDSASTCS